MNLDIKFKSIKARWFVNIFLTFAIVVCAVAIAFCTLYVSIYNERISSLAQDYSNEFNSLASTSKESFHDAAIMIAGSFEHKDKLEVQVIDNDSNVIVSTTGFQSKTGPMPDYENAKKSGKYFALRSKTASGESIMAGTTMLYTASGEPIGAYRWITSMESADKKVGYFILFVCIVAFVVLAFCFMMGFYFIRSIVNPIKNVSNTARKIASGNLESSIEVEKNDEIGELCDTINYMAAELRQAQNLKNEFISSVSHELRTPLTAIRGWGETAKMSLGTDEELVSRGLDVVLSEADRLSSLVEELLDFSRMESGRMSYVTQVVDVEKLLIESANMYTEIAKKQEIELVYTNPQEEITVMGDPNRLKQVFINIIDNAVKYTNAGGQVLISQVVEEACVRITISDTGVGIPAQDIDRIKEKFYKANKTVRGSGIGLAVADEIIKQHQGLLFVESTEGVGTMVTIVLPIYVPETPKETEAEATEE